MEQLDTQSERIQGDLRGLVAGDVRCDVLFCQLFAGDGSVYEIRPAGVVRPRNVADVMATIQYAADKDLPIHVRGAGTGAAGGCLGPGLVLDLSRYFHRVLESGDNWARVQAGVVRERLNHHLRRQGRQFLADPTDRAAGTVGGAMAVNAAGSYWPKFGPLGRHVRRMQVVLADGKPMEVGREPLRQGVSDDSDPRKRELVNSLAAILGNHRESIRRHGTRCAVDSCGYRLEGILRDDALDLVGLLVGSEGTLGIITEATLTTQPLPRHRGVALLLFDSIDKALRAATCIAAREPNACDLLDRRHLSLAGQTDIRFEALVPRQTEAALIVEHEGERAGEVEERIETLVEEIWQSRHLAFGSLQAFDPDEVDLFWRLTHAIQPPASRLGGSARPVPVLDDIAVPVESLSDFLVRCQNLFKRHEVTISLSAHALQGQIRFQPFLDLTHPFDVAKMRKIAEELYGEVIVFGGTISAARGCGLVRTPFVQRQKGPLFDVFGEIKRLFDPDNRLNPGKVVDGRWSQFTRDLRPTIPRSSVEEQPAAGVPPSDGLRNLVELQLNWEPSRVIEAVDDCNACGDCRTQSPSQRMCPLFRIGAAEEASPRAKVSLLRGVLTGRLDLNCLSTEEFNQVAKLCFGCHMCRQECPSEVDIPRLMVEGKGAYVAARGLTLKDHILARSDRLAALASVLPNVANWALRNGTSRWLMERTLGIAQGRKLPRVVRRTFLRRAAHRRLTKPRRRRDRNVALFADTYVNYHDPQLGEALLAVLKHNDVAVYVPPKQKQAGTTAIVLGDLDFARRLAHHNAMILAEAVRQGYHIVTTEPAAALTLRREYLYLFDEDETQLVAENTSDACQYLWGLHVNGALRLDFKPIHATVGYHWPCRMKALGVGAPGRNLLRLIPGLTVREIDAGCSGMAGTFGLKAQNYRTSLRIGWGLISALRDPDIEAGATECSACKIQMEQGTVKPTVHPIKLLAMAYGLMPELDTLLTTRGENLVTT